MRRTTATVALFFAAATAYAQIPIRRISTAVTIDGNVSPAEWSGAGRTDQWYEFNPGDSVEPKVRTTAFLAYDDRFLYAAFVCQDPDPAAVRAPYTDRDNLGELTDFAGLIINPSGDRKTGFEFLANARGVQFDAINSDASGEDSAPDFYWDSAGRITPEGWTLEIRIPFSSLRYTPGDETKWGVLLYRNYGRERRYQLASQAVPHGTNCFVCLMKPLAGLSGLPSGSHLILAPYAAMSRDSVPSTSTDTRLGADAKWNPNANMAVDATVNPDFSQVESDVAAITTNERFAVFFPEKRPFFLEGKDLFKTPLEAVYTRTINSPRWGLRSTGTIGATAYTLLVADDRGGGIVILPGPNGSDTVDADFRSRNLIGRVRRDIGQSFASFLVTDREISGGGHNRVAGPDFLWRAGADDNVRGQILLSDTADPASRGFTSHAAQLEWSHSTPAVDWFLMLTDRGDRFRADLGFIPQVGTKESFGWAGYTVRPSGFFSRVRTFVEADYTGQQNGWLVYRFVQPGVEADGRWASYARLAVAFDRIRAGEHTLRRTQWHWELAAHPSRIVQFIGAEGRFGSDIDFAGGRLGRGGDIEAEAQIRPTDHLELALRSEYRQLDLRGGTRLFTARVERVKATYNFTSRQFLRLIGQHVRTDAASSEGSRFLSALYAYKLNWQTVLYVGYGDESALFGSRYEPAARQAFVKVSYAWQR